MHDADFRAGDAGNRGGKPCSVWRQRCAPVKALSVTRLITKRARLSMPLAHTEVSLSCQPPS